MSDGGLLQKAMEQQTGDTELVAEAIAGEPTDQSASSVSQILLTIFLGAILPFFVMMWFGVYLDVIPLTILTPLVLIASFSFVWWKLDVGLPSQFGGRGISMAPAFAIFATFLLLLGTPFLLATILVGDISFSDADFDDEGETLTLKIRQNGGSGTHMADITIEQLGAEVFTTSAEFTISESDGLGDYGTITLYTHRFYSQNALPSSDYKINVEIDGESHSKTLDANFLTRTITQAGASTTASMTTNSDECGTKASCVQGVGLTVEAGLMGAAGYPASPLPFAYYTMTATLYYEDSVAIQYPFIFVDNTRATWDGMEGDFGSGSGVIGASGSSMALGGSEYGADIQMDIIPKTEWQESDLGCYRFVVEVSQDPPYAGPNPISAESFYLYEENEGDSETDIVETWTEVESC